MRGQMDPGLAPRARLLLRGEWQEGQGRGLGFLSCFLGPPGLVGGAPFFLLETSPSHPVSSPSLTGSGHTGPLDVPPVADGPTPGLSTSVLPLRRAPPRRAAGVWRFQPPALVRSWGWG